MSLDLAFILDCTGSMGSYISMSKTMITDVVVSVLDDPNIESCRLAMIAYEDYSDGARLIDTKDFVASPNEFKAFVNLKQAGGGGDFPEALELAMETLPMLSWRNGSAHVVVIITDAPPHGCGVSGDSYPLGSKDATPQHHFAAIAQRLSVSNLGLRIIGVNVTGHRDTERSLREIVSVIGGMYCVIGQTKELSNFITRTASAAPGESKQYSAVLAALQKRHSANEVQGVHSLHAVGLEAGLTGDDVPLQVAKILSSRAIPENLSQYKSMLNSAAASVGAKWIAASKENEAPELTFGNVSLTASVWKDSFAKLDLLYPVTNAGKSDLEVSFRLPLPRDWALDWVKFQVGDGEWKTCRVESKKKAAAIYEDAIASGSTALIVELEPSGKAVTIGIGALAPGQQCSVRVAYAIALTGCTGAVEIPSLLFPAAPGKEGEYSVTAEVQGLATSHAVFNGAAHPVSKWPSEATLTAHTGAGLMWDPAPISVLAIPLGGPDVAVRVKYGHTKPSGGACKEPIVLLPDPWSLRSAAAQQSLLAVAEFLQQAVEEKLLDSDVVSIILPNKEEKDKYSYTTSKGMANVKKALSEFFGKIGQFNFNKAYLGHAVPKSINGRVVLFIDAFYFHDYSELVPGLKECPIWVCGAASARAAVSATGAAHLGKLKASFARPGDEARAVRALLRKGDAKATLAATLTGGEILNSYTSTLTHCDGGDESFIHVTTTPEGSLSLQLTSTGEPYTYTVEIGALREEAVPEAGPDARIAVARVQQTMQTVEYAVKWAVLCSETALVAVADTLPDRAPSEGPMRKAEVAARDGDAYEICDTVSSSRPEKCIRYGATKKSIGDDRMLARGECLEDIKEACEGSRYMTLGAREELSCASSSFKRKARGLSFTDKVKDLFGGFSMKKSSPPPSSSMARHEGDFCVPPPPPPPGAMMCAAAPCGPPPPKPGPSKSCAPPPCPPASSCDSPPAAPVKPATSAEAAKAIQSLLRRRQKEGLPFRATEAVLSLVEILVPSFSAKGATDASISKLIVDYIANHVKELDSILEAAGVTIAELKAQLAA